MKTTAPMATPIAATTAMTITMTQEEFDDSFDDIIHGGFFDDDDHGGGNESCFFPLGECDQTAKFWLAIASESDPDGQYKFFLCPRHFALRLHLILDATRRNVYFDELNTPAQIREVFQSYFLDWGRIRL
ncbi:hypothetical protein BISA_1402 [Bifidobacterium saguini DSM 23967]|uniref:Uncharacterized protein n=2 Tax=Bifidobacterium saguini TaxID=762210 RepID=A0A087DCR6_9BIFI|nr:hypothetical protein [Bifidobacterium saguini]KFI93316.1 hypothetical protein BISA_1402 [Bifidobacterium saguini DSM 23967]QTB90530.1 hypothetical protein BSD967_09455 [Bifidobacterium saguini]